MESSAIVIFAKWQVGPGNLDKVITALDQLAQASRKEEGNLDYRAHSSLDDENCILLFETYRDKEALEIHRNSAHYQNLGLNTIVPLLSHREVSITQEIFKTKS